MKKEFGLHGKQENKHDSTKKRKPLLSLRHLPSDDPKTTIFSSFDLSKKMFGLGKSEKQKPFDYQSPIDAAISKLQKTTFAERHPDWPKIKEMKIYLSLHLSAYDWRRFPELMHEVDIYIPEGFGRKEYFQHVADGKMYNGSSSSLSVDEYIETQKSNNPFFKGTYKEQQIRTLYRSGVICGHIDLRKDDLLTETILEQSFRIDSDFDVTLSNKYADIKEKQTAQNEREKFMTFNFEKELDAIFKRYPHLKNKQEISILLTMGERHPSLVTKLQSIGIDVQAEYNPTRTIDYESQVEHFVDTGEIPPRDLLARTYLEDQTITAFYKKMYWGKKQYDGELIYRYATLIASHFDTKKIEEYHKLLMQKPEFQALVDFLETNGCGPLPNSNRELKSVSEKLQASGIKPIFYTQKRETI